MKCFVHIAFLQIAILSPKPIEQYDIINYSIHPYSDFVALFIEGPKADELRFWN